MAMAATARFESTSFPNSTPRSRFDLYSSSLLLNALRSWPSSIASISSRAAPEKSASIDTGLPSNRRPQLLLPSLIVVLAVKRDSITKLFGVQETMERKMVITEQEPLSLDFASISTLVLQCSIDSNGTDSKFEWRDYSLPVFRKLQEFQELDIDDYMVSICGPETLKLLTKKKSVSSIPLPHDDRFILKTITKSQMKVFLEILPKYYVHVRKNKNTLLTKFFGLHSVKPQGGQKVRFLVCGNILRSDLCIHKHYVLRVPPHGHHFSKRVQEDLNLAFHLHAPLQRKLMMQLNKDCKFLEKVGIVHYSLLLGIHICHAPFEAVLEARHSSLHSSGSDDVIRSSDRPESEHSDADEDLISDKNSTSSCSAGIEGKLGVKMAAQAVAFQKKETTLASSYTGKDQLNNVFLFFGIIDIFQGCSILKHMELVFRSLKTDAPSISGINPREYSTNFQEYLSQVFPKSDYESLVL
ncbi:phosphatidylinositol 4-phosphate 5-kinase 10-like [Canna indica]|uniref:1-phosphatidylinositol-4-phosphate 5-kinase n=1 Tax=Canna indica TaxID=4628 RepID=A0AAQ3KLI7_9LILI|nr:phosphatidylinositol 4-phosphate 5-kinase 10-like [Canna indica]